MTTLGLSDVARDKSDVEVTVDYIVSIQRQSGMIPWSARQHCDPWNHTEAAMALTVGGEIDRAARALRWLANSQCDNGGWYASCWPDESVKDAHIDTNMTAYVATGLWHFFSTTDDEQFVREMFPVVQRAIELVVSCQMPSGAISWEIAADGARSDGALLAGSSSIFQSLLAAISLGGVVGVDTSAWERSARALRHSIANPGLFLAKDEFAMDWYYPVLSGVCVGDAANKRLASGYERYVLAGCGVLCRSDRRWVTTAETAELAIAHLRCGQLDAANTLIGFLESARDDDGSYATGIVYPEMIEFPMAERTTYSAAAVVLAYDAVFGGAATTSTFSLELSGDDHDGDPKCVR